MLPGAASTVSVSCCTPATFTSIGTPDDPDDSTGDWYSRPPSPYTWNTTDDAVNPSPSTPIVASNREYAPFSAIVVDDPPVIPRPFAYETPPRPIGLPRLSTSAFTVPAVVVGVRALA